MKHILTTVFLIGLCEIKAYSSTVITNVVVYNPPAKIGSLYKENLSFGEIDRTRPEGILFCLTKVVNSNQVDEIYSKELDKHSRIMEHLRTKIPEEREMWRRVELIFSFYYYGDYGPPHWFAYAKSPDFSYLIPVKLVLENGEWHKYTDIGGYPVRIAFSDLIRKHGWRIPDGKVSLSKSDIEAFIKDCREIDDIITEGMAEDPDHYGPVQILK